MYYSKGNYEAFARPRKPENVEAKSAYLVGAGLASLAAAAFLIRDGRMAGDRITILEASVRISCSAPDHMASPAQRQGSLRHPGDE